MKKEHRIILGITLFCAFFSIAQESKIKEANTYYNENSYIDATKVYLDVAESGYKSQELFKKLGNSFYFNANYAEAVKWYNELYDLAGNTLESEYLLRYSQSLKASSNQEKAKEIYNTFLEKAGIPNKRLSSSAKYLNIIAKNGDRYELYNLDFNSGSTDYGAFIRDSTLYFSSNRTGKKNAKIDAWSGTPFLDIYSVAYNAETGTTSGTPKIVEGVANSKFHESSPVITKDGNTMYFTSSNATPRIQLTNKDKVQLKIYRATKTGDTWGNIEDLSINGDTYSNAHPALSPDEKTLYFASNMPTSTGQTDIFAVRINPDGRFGVPKNLGSKINTKGRESFPFVTEENELYFASDGHFGLGGYDVFYVDLKYKKQDLYNVGEPVNSSKDDYAFSIDNTNKKGFFTSDRMGVDNIYSFLETKPMKDAFKIELKGTIRDERTGDPLPNATVTAVDEDNNVIATTRTIEDGSYSFTVDGGLLHSIKAYKQTYDIRDKYLSEDQDLEKVDIDLNKNKYEIIADNGYNTDAATDLASALNIKQIYFDYDSANIRYDAIVELEKVVAVLKSNDNLKIDIRAYTDSRGEKNYNYALSQKRAASTLAYLKNKGIRASRLSFQGFGESRLMNHCEDGANCSEAQHQENRRTEFIIVSK